MLGPMVNPAFPKKQLVGVFSLELARLYAYLYQQSNKSFVILHSLDGYDEVSLTGSFKAISNGGELVISPQDLGLARHNPELLSGGNTIEESSKIFTNILQGDGTVAQNDVVIANAGMAIHCASEESSLSDAVDCAKESLESGKALEVFKKMIKH